MKDTTESGNNHDAWLRRARLVQLANAAPIKGRADAVRNARKLLLFYSTVSGVERSKPNYLRSYWSITTIAKALNTTRRSVERANSRLELQGIIQRQNNGQTITVRIMLSRGNEAYMLGDDDEGVRQLVRESVAGNGVRQLVRESVAGNGQGATVNGISVAGGTTVSPRKSVAGGATVSPRKSVAQRKLTKLTKGAKPTEKKEKPRAKPKPKQSTDKRNGQAEKAPKDEVLDMSVIRAEFAKDIARYGYKRACEIALQAVNK